MGKGFIWIELIVVTLILAILAAIAIPRWFDLSKNIKKDAIRRLAESITTANDSNQLKRLKNTKNTIKIYNCTDGKDLLEEGLPVEYKIDSLEIASGKTVSCTLTGPEATSAKFSLSGIR